MITRAPRRTRLSLVAAMALLFACTGDKGAGNGGSGGSTGGTGGTSTNSATGGATATSTGGASVGTGGALAGTGGGSGGAVSGTGGAATGGSLSGTGGGRGGVLSGTGGAATGGTLAGTGGAATGGSGVPGSGGASAGGAGGSAGGSGLGGQGGGGGAGGQTGTGGRAAGGAGGSAGASGAAGGSSLGGQGGRGGAGGQTGGQSGSDGGTASGTACASTLPAITDYTAAGPYATTTDSNTGPDGKCTIFRPKTLGENGFLHAPIVFGPGISMQASQLSGLLLSFASHGFVVIGTGVLTGGPNDPGNKSQMQNALDWIIKQNSQAGTFQGKLAVKCAISMGYSVGGTSAVEIGGDPAVATTVSIHGHIATSAMHGPLLQTSGTADTVGHPMQQQTFDKSQVQTFFGTVSGADHGYIQSNNGGAERPAIIAWMRYWINGDTGAKKYFWGDTCVCCTAPWTDPQRKNWQ